MRGMDYRQPGDTTRCPHCRAAMEQHDSLNRERRTPAEGSVTICAGCQGVSLFFLAVEGRLSLRAATSDEITEFMQHKVFREAVAMVKAVPVGQLSKAAAGVRARARARPSKRRR